MNKKTVKYVIDSNNHPLMSNEKAQSLKNLSLLPDSEIDYSDIPPLTEEFWKQAVRNPFYKPTKALTTVRVDADVLAWLKSKGKGYQTRLNAILRAAMLEEIS
jgi:uncharacterized protein (DUF4415 family)